MQKLNAHGKLVLGLVLALTAALPLACGSDDSKGIPPDGEGGEAGEGGSAAAGKGGSAGKGGAAQAGGTFAGGGGAPEAGAPEMGGEGGAIEAAAGAAGAEEMGGAGGGAGDASDAMYTANVEAACTTEGSLNCSGSGAAADKQACVDNYTGLPDFFPECGTKVKAFLACIAPLPATSFECTDMLANQKVEFCNDEYLAMFDCFSPPQP